MKREPYPSCRLWDFISLWICCPHNKLVEENGLTSSANWLGKFLKQWCAGFHVLAANAAHGKIWLLSKKEIIQLNISRYVLCLQIVDILFWFSSGNYLFCLWVDSKILPCGSSDKLWSSEFPATDSVHGENSLENCRILLCPMCVALWRSLNWQGAFR